MTDIALQALGNDSSTAGVLPVTAILGIGGSGKSTTAAAYAHAPATRERFPDGVFWVTLGPEPQIGSLLTSWVIAAEGHATEPLPEGASSSYLRTAYRERAALFVIDDVWDEDHVTPFLVGGNRCQVLLTSRRAHIADQLGATVVEVIEMTSEESFSLLLKRVGPARAALMSAADLTEAQLLTQQISYLPLAIELVAALVARHYTWSDTRRQLVDMEARLPAQSGKESLARRKIDSCLGLSLTVLREDDPDAWESFIWLAPLPYEQSIHTNMACTLWEVNEHEASRRLQALADDGILRRHGRSYSVHNLLHQMARKLFSLAAPEGLGMRLQQGHRIVVDRYRKTLPQGKWDNVEDDGYIAGRLVWHLYHAEDYDAIFELACAEDDHGLNSWYQRKFHANQMAGYLEDIELIRKAAVASGNLPRQVFAILCHSSINSLTSHYGSETVAALVQRGIWSATFAFEWIIDLCEQSRRAEFLIDLAIAIRVITTDTGTRHPELEDIANEALSRAQNALLQHTPTVAAVALMQRYMSALPVLNVHILKSIYGWCGAARVHKMLTSLSPDVRQGLVEQLYDHVGVPHAPLEHLVFLSTLISQGADAKRMQRCEAALELLEESMFELLAVGRPKDDTPASDELPALSPPNTMQGAAIALQTQSSTSDQASDQPSVNPEHYGQCLSAIQTLVANLPPELLARAESLLLNVADYAGVDELLRKLRLPADARDEDADPHAFIDHAIAAGNLSYAVRSALTFASNGDAQAIFKVLPFITPYDVDLTLAKLGLSASQLPVEKLRHIAEQLALINPEALAPRMILSKGRLGGRDFVSKIERSDVHDAGTMALVCILYGSREIALDALNAISKIRDRKEEVEAALALMPFVPHDQRGTLYKDLRTGALAGAQIAGMTEIMLLLSSAIEAGSLADVVESTSKLHSEWWVVEAMSVTILRISSSEEINSVLACMPQIKNADLRARILERIALRMADLGQSVSAIEACTAIGLEFAQWDALGELCKRFAAAGDVESAVAAASRITSTERSSKAFLDIAFEAGAQGRPAEARAIAAKHVISQEWRQLADRFLHANSPAHDLPKGPIVPRNTYERGFTRFELVSQGIARAETIVGRHAALQRIAVAADASDRAAMERAIRDAWNETALPQLTLSAAFHNMRRPVLLKVLSALAPIFECDGDSSNAAPVVESVRRVCRWWP